MRADLVGQEAGSVSARSYLTIGFGGRYYLAHRLAWLYVTGTWPASDIDHRDGDKLNNSFLNLRVVSEHVNLQNQRRAHRNNKCGLLGVSQQAQGYVARIWANGRKHCLGTFKTADAAHHAYVEAKRRLHPGSTL